MIKNSRLIPLVMFLFVFAGTGFSQYGVENVLRKYKNDENVLSMSLEGNLSSLFPQNDSIKSIVKTLSFVMFEGGNDLSAKDQKRIKERIKTDQYDLLVSVREGDKKVKIYGIDHDDSISKAFAQINSEEFNIYVVFEGNLYYEELSKIKFDKLDKMVRF